MDAAAKAAAAKAVNDTASLPARLRFGLRWLRRSFRDDLRIWMRVSAAGIGGPALQIATMHRLLVHKRRWISEERFFHALSYCIAMPGPETQQLSIYIGWLSRRTIGGVIAGGLFILPGIICMMALSIGFVTGANSQIGQAIFFGVKPAILAIMTEAILRFGRHVLHGRWMYAVAALAFAAAFAKVAFPLIVLVAALLGLGAAMTGPRKLRGEAAEAATDDAEELPDHTRPSTARAMRSLAAWTAIWFAPSIALLAVLGPANVFTQISLLCSKVAFMAVGGDYAVVAYAAQQAIDSYHWVTAREMQDGIAMGEMVPGTIMIVTQFLGFIAAYRDPGQLPPMLAGVLGGLLASWATFVPCFLWIFVIAPFIEHLRHNDLLNGPMRAITAAAVGMIVNLSVWFGIRTLFRDVEPFHFSGLAFDVPTFWSLDLWALGLFIASAIAVLRYKFSAIATLAASSVVGMILMLLGVLGPGS